MTFEFIIVGDPHVTDNYNANTNRRFRQVINCINNSNADYAIFIGDNSDRAFENHFKELYNYIPHLKKPHFIVCGNHDIGIVATGGKCYTNNTGTHKECWFHKYSGKWPDQFYKIQKNNVNLQIIVVGIHGYNVNGHFVNSWYFNFDNTNIDKTKPTLVLIHGNIKHEINNNTNICHWDDFYNYPIVYPSNILTKLNEFSNIIGIISGHSHINLKNNIVIGTKTVPYYIIDSLSTSIGAGCNTISSPYIKKITIANNYSITDQNIEYTSFSDSLDTNMNFGYVAAIIFIIIILFMVLS